MPAVRQARPPGGLGGRDRRADRGRRRLLVRRLARQEYDRLCEQLVRRRHDAAPEPRAAPEQLPGPQRPERRRARRGPHLHLQRAAGGRRPDQQLDGAGRDARAAADRRERAVQGLRCAAARCTWCRSRWGRWARTSRTSASS
ncbi:MAG: hypothetical protein MZW92_19215 [Comamonadaceae bacterium]|nr:hypothetical protein [Comamonadaceae bacterium]